MCLQADSVQEVVMDELAVHDKFTTCAPPPPPPPSPGIPPLCHAVKRGQQTGEAFAVLRAGLVVSFMS